MKIGPFRRTYIIKPKAQLRIGFYFGVLSLVGIASTVGAIIIIPSLITSLSQTRTIDSLPFLEIGEEIWPWLIIAGILYFIYSFILGIIFSLHFMGPLYRVEKLINKRVSGNSIGPITLRHGDMLVDFVEHISEYLDRVADVERKAIDVVNAHQAESINPDELALLIGKLSTALDTEFTQAKPAE
jgi:hypothetical protein